MSKLKIEIKKDMLSDFVDKLDNLTEISDNIKIKIDNDNILMYSILGGSVILAFKNFLLKADDYFIFKEIDFTLDMIIVNSKKFVKNINFIKDSPNVFMEIEYNLSKEDDSIAHARSIRINGGKLKVNWISGEHYEVKDISKISLNQKLDLRLKKWSFGISRSDFQDIKKLSSINSDKILSINISDGRVIFSEKSAWELELDSVDDSIKANLMLNKRFLKCIDDTTDINFNIFDNFMLIKDEMSNLMLSFEQNFEYDD